MTRVAGKLAMRCGVELPERPDLEALPTASGSGRARLGQWMLQLVADGPAAHGRRIEGEAQASEHFGSRQAIRRGWFGRQQFAQERFHPWRPVRGVIPTGGTGLPASGLPEGRRAEIVGVEFVEASATEAELFGHGRGGDFRAPESGKNFADQRRAETMGKLAKMFFISHTMAVSDEQTKLPLLQPCGPSVGLRYAPASSRPAGLECSPLLARLSGFARTLFAFARNATPPKPVLTARTLGKAPSNWVSAIVWDCCPSALPSDGGIPER